MADATPFISAFYQQWGAISVTLAALSVIAAAMLIVLSRMFSLKNLEQVAKTEFIFAVSTVLIVALTVTLVGEGETMFMQIARCTYLATFGCDCDSPVHLEPEMLDHRTIIDYVDLYMKRPKECAITSLDALYIMSIPIEAGASVYTEVFMSEIASGYGFKPFAERIRNSAQMITFYLYIYYIVFYTLKFVKHFGGLFFTIGVALRAFPPTRGAGAYLMAAAVGFYFVFPLAYVLFATMSLPHAWETTPLTQTTYEYNKEYGDNLPHYYCTDVDREGHFDEICSLPSLTGIYDAGCGSGDKRWVDSMIASIHANKNEIINFLDPRLGSITKLFTRLINNVCIIPVVALVITMTFILNTTNLFGGNIPEIGRGLVKLI